MRTILNLLIPPPDLLPSRPSPVNRLVSRRVCLGLCSEAADSCMLRSVASEIVKRDNVDPSCAAQPLPCAGEIRRGGGEWRAGWDCGVHWSEFRPNADGHGMCRGENGLVAVVVEHDAVVVANGALNPPRMCL